jgi:hypothetical protein
LLLLLLLLLLGIRLWLALWYPLVGKHGQVWNVTVGLLAMMVLPAII